MDSEASQRPIRIRAAVTLWTSAALLAATTWAVAPSFARPPQRFVRLTYERTAGTERCPEADALENEVAARLGYRPFRPNAPGAVNVTFRAEGKTLRARLVLTNDSGRETASRDLQSKGGDCDELVRTVAVAIGLALDPLTVSPPASSAPPASAASSPAPGPAASSVPPIAAPPIPSSAAPVIRPVPGPTHAGPAIPRSIVGRGGRRRIPFAGNGAGFHSRALRPNRPAP